MKKLLICMVLFILTLTSSSCSYNNLVNSDDNLNITNDLFNKDAIYNSQDSSYSIIGDLNSTYEFFRNEIGISNLTEHSFYYSSLDKKYNFVIKFNQNVSNAEITNFMSYFYNLFIYLNGSKIGEVPYERELLYGKNRISNSKEKPYNDLSLRVYINNIKAFKYDFHFNNINDNDFTYTYWENSYIDYNFKELESDIYTDFIKNNKSRKYENIIIRKSFKNDNLIIVKIKSNKNITNEEILTLQDNIILKLKENNNIEGFILQLQVKDNILKEYVYPLKENKWLENVNWMNYEF